MNLGKANMLVSLRILDLIFMPICRGRSSTLQEALSSVDATLWQVAIWQVAIEDEMESLESNTTCHLVDLPPECNIIGCKWILKKKLKPYGTIEKYKA